MDTRAPANEDPAPFPSAAPHPPEDLDPFAGRDRGAYVALARRWLRRLRVEEAVLSAEGAVHEAWIRLRPRTRGGVPSIGTCEALDRAFARSLRQVILDRWRRQQARKRRSPAPERHDPALLEIIDLRARRPEEPVIGEEYVAWLLAVLDRRGAGLRRIVILRLDGLSNAEIATELGLAVKSIERKLREIRSILGPYLGGEDHRR